MYIVLLIVFVLFPAATFLHELGHYMTARLTRVRHARIQIGLGPTIFQLDNPLLRIDFRLFYFAGAHTLSGDSEETSPFSRLLITVNGPLINAVAAMYIWIFLRIDFSPLMNESLNMFAFINLWIAIGNLLPFKINDRKSDGYIIVQSLWSFVTKTRQI